MIHLRPKVDQNTISRLYENIHDRTLKRCLFELGDLYDSYLYQYTDQGKLHKEPNGRIVRTELSVRYWFI